MVESKNVEPVDPEGRPNCAILHRGLSICVGGGVLEPRSRGNYQGTAVLRKPRL